MTISKNKKSASGLKDHIALEQLSNDTNQTRQKLKYSEEKDRLNDSEFEKTDTKKPKLNGNTLPEEELHLSEEVSI